MNNNQTANITAADIAADAAWFPSALDINAGMVNFARINRAGLAREAFLDQRMAGSVTGAATARVNDLAAAFPAQRAPVFIFHTAFCCSTLMARALDIPGQCLSLKEPNIIMDVANAYRMASGAAKRNAVDDAGKLVINMLARPHQGNERVLIKPTNTANNLVQGLTANGARAILLYSDLKGFLLSVLKKGEACKAFVRKQYTIFALDEGGVNAIPERQALGFTDLQIAALVWRHQMEMFARLLSAPGADNLRSLNFRALLKSPATVLKAAGAHLQLGIDDATLEAAATGPVFAKNAKFDNQQYSAEHRAKDEAALEERYGEEIAMIEHWALQITLATDIPAQMPKPL